MLDDHCETRVEVRSPAGEFVTGRVLSAPLADGFADPQRDVAAFCAPANPDAPVLPLADVTVSAGAPVAVHGHILLGDEGAGGVVPTVVEGEIITTDGPRAFIDTGKDACEMGMCGGPVLTETGECAGILEGVVPRLGDGEEPLSDLHARIAGSAAFIGADELRLFLADVERTIAQTQEGGAR